MLTPHTLTIYECAYCEWCMSNGCYVREEGYESVNLKRCNCDCILVYKNTLVTNILRIVFYNVIWVCVNCAKMKLVAECLNIAIRVLH